MYRPLLVPMAAAAKAAPKMASEALKAQLSDEAERMDSLKTFVFATSKIVDIVTLFPPYARERYALRTVNKKSISNAVNIEGFYLKTPFGDQTLLNGTDLVLEPGKRQCLYGANCMLRIRHTQRNALPAPVCY